MTDSESPAAAKRRPQVNPHIPCCGTSLSLLQVSRSDLNVEFDEMDTNSDGVVTREEFARYFEKVSESPATTGSLWRLNYVEGAPAPAPKPAPAAEAPGPEPAASTRSDRITRVKFLAKGGTNEEFDRYDRDHNNVLDKDELEERAAVQQRAQSDARRMDPQGSGEKLGRKASSVPPGK